MGSLETPQGGRGSPDLIQSDTQASSGAGRGSSFADDADGDPYEYSVSVRLADDDGTNEEIDLSTLSDEDIRRIKKEDPFLYYSIPAAKRGSYLFADEDELLSAVRSSSSRRSSLPAEVLAVADVNIDRSRYQQQVPIVEGPSRRDSVVRRNRRCSTEAHPTLVCDELLRELQGLDDESGDDDLDILMMRLDAL